MQSLQHRLIEQQFKNDRTVALAESWLENGPRRLWRLGVECLETALQSRAALKQQITLACSIVQRLEEILADEDLRWYQEHRALSSERLSAHSMSGALEGLLRMQEGLSVDLYQMVLLIIEHEKRTKEIGVMSKKIKEQIEGMSLWESLKDALVG